MKLTISCAFLMPSRKVGDGTLEVKTSTVITPVSGCAADSKSGRCKIASTTTLSRPGFYLTEMLYSAKMTPFLPFVERDVDCLRSRNVAWSVLTITGPSPNRYNLTFSTRTSWQDDPFHGQGSYV